MQTSKIGLRNLIKRRLVRLAVIFAVLFSLSSIAQFCFVRWRILATTRDELDRLASQVSEEISYLNTWNLAGFRRSIIEAPSFCVFSADGVMIDMEGFASDFSFSVAAPVVVLRGSPVTFVSELGEKWHLFHKKVQGGWILLGLLDDPSINNPDQLLLANAEKVGSTLKEAVRTEPREIDWKVDYAVVDDSGLLRFAAGGVPLRIDRRYFDRFPKGGSVVNLKTQTYAIFSRSITDTQGGVVGSIIVPKKMTAELLVLHAQTLFNVSLAAFAWLVVVGVVVGYTIGDERKRQSEAVTLDEALARGEGQTIEFKEGVPADVLPRVLAAFANAEGGCVFLGVTDDLRVVGLGETTPEARDRLQRQIRQLTEQISPRINPDVSFLDHQGKTVAKIFVPRGVEPLYMVDGVVWTRRLSVVEKAKPEQIRERLKKV